MDKIIHPLGPFHYIASWQNLSVSLLAIAVVVSALVLVYSKQELRNLHVKSQQLQKTAINLQINLSRLLLERGTWTSDHRVEQVATEQLNMLLPSRKKVRLIKP